MTRRRMFANVMVTTLLIPVAAIAALLEVSSVDRSQCDWETFDNFCSDYKGAYGTIAVALLILWALLTYAINKSRPEGR